MNRSYHEPSRHSRPECPQKIHHTHGFPSTSTHCHHHGRRPLELTYKKETPKPEEFLWLPFRRKKEEGQRVKLKDRSGKEVDVYLKEEGDIGKGTFGNVKSVVIKAHKEQAERLAMKVTVSGEDDLGIIEANIMLKLNHLNCVLLKYYFEEKGSVRLIMEMMEEGDLYHLIHRAWKPNKGLGVYCELFGFQIFRGLAYMHSLGIAHRDIKPENVLISRASGLAKLTDFNCSTKMSDKREHSPRVGTKTYNPPELFLQSRLYDEKIDVWSAGVVLTAMIIRHSVFLAGAVGRPIEPFQCILDYLGSPTKDDFYRMKISEEDIQNCPQVMKTKSFNKAVGHAPGIHDKRRLMELLPHIFTYKVNKRFTAYQVCSHSLFDYIRSGHARLQNGYGVPDVFGFEQNEILYQYH